MQMWVHTEVPTVLVNSMLNLSSAYMTHGTSHGSFCRNAIVTIWFKYSSWSMSFYPYPQFNRIFHTSIWVTLFSEQMVRLCTLIEITWKTEGCPMHFFTTSSTSTVAFTSELLTCFFFISDASVTPIKMVRKDKWVVTGTHLELLFCQIHSRYSRFPESILTDSQSF